MAAISQTTFSNAFFNEHVRISIQFSLKFVPLGLNLKEPNIGLDNG